MNTALETLIKEYRLNASENDRAKWDFVAACAARVKHLLEDPAVVDCVDVLQSFVKGDVGEEVLIAAQSRAAEMANKHRGSPSIDGCGHAAVSASYAIANALSGKPVETADCAAYAMVYAQGGAAAVADRDSFVSEFAWQIDVLKSITRAVPA